MFGTVFISHLTVSTVFLGLLLRALWRYERRVEAIIADLAKEDVASERLFDETRAEIRAATRARVDRAIEQMQTPLDRTSVELPTQTNDHTAEPLPDPDTEVPIAPQSQAVPH